MPFGGFLAPPSRLKCRLRYCTLNYVL
jgi:hypothetical protein